MKRISVYLLGLIMSGVLFVACDDDDDDKLTFDKTSVEVIIGEEAVAKVSGGVAPFKADAADKAVVETTVDGRDITLKALKVGNTTVKVTDKDGLEASIAVTVKEDPYAEDKADATVRIKWGENKKVSGTDAGTYTLIKSTEKDVIFSWINEEEDESWVLTLEDPQDKIGGVKSTGPATPVGKLTVTEKGKDPVDYDVAAWSLLQAQPADEEEGTPDTYWISFNANTKEGLVVAPLKVETE
ncbi:hypothetical protein [Proteiniphilum sp. UBA5384]|uniref:hypothetical protein n=1 Tax=Proteiniphilum sp. UBA5384 TaxID=1947279 RepID=UPI0025E606A2|nr:hypothetical protein [Proteiniphilum sp. UBA5384]